MVLQVHAHPQRQQHHRSPLDIPTGCVGRSIPHALTREKLELFAVLCIETSHYVSFIKYGQNNQDWIFFDSMADRQGELPMVFSHHMSFPTLWLGCTSFRWKRGLQHPWGSSLPRGRHLLGNVCCRAGQSGTSKHEGRSQTSLLRRLHVPVPEHHHVSLSLRGTTITWKRHLLSMLEIGNQIAVLYFIFAGFAFFYESVLFSFFSL